MTSFASVGMALAMAPGLLATAPATPPDGAPPVPPAVAERVAERIAGEWRVPAAALQLDWGRASGRQPESDASFRLVGKGADGWFVAVFDPPTSRALSVRVRAGVDDTVMVAARPLAAGTRLGPDDARPEPRLRWGPPADDAAPVPGPGWEVRRPLASGEPLVWPAVVPPQVISPGEPVRLLWVHGGVSVTLTGVALNAARQGETVRVRVEGRRNRLVGIATGPGMATLANGDLP
jgi:flagella basal body P-ring formation protein FlgA